VKAKKILLLLALAAGCATTPDWRPPTDAQMAAVKEGMSRSEVEKILGREPDGGTERKGSEIVSAWRLQPAAGATADIVYFQVHYRNSRVTRTTRARLYEPSL
jgi:hypothetical protein